MIVLAMLGTQRLVAQSIMPPPFGMHWGDTPDKVLDWAMSKGLDVVIKIPGDHPEIRDFRVSSIVGPLPSHQAYALQARYHEGRLFEVSLHYGAPGMKVSSLRIAFEQLRKAMALKYGQLIPDNKRETKKDGYIRRSKSYHVEPVSGLLLLLAFTEVEDTVRKKHSARFSLLYRNQNILPKKTVVPPPSR